MNELEGLEVLRDCSLKAYNTFGIDVKADTLVLLRGQADYERLVASGVLRERPFIVLGGGSNVVFKGDYNGVVVHPVNQGVRMVEHGGGFYFVEAEAGVVWDVFVQYAVENQWFGIENLAGIPGTVGAAPVQNVGAYGMEAKDVIERVHLFDIETGKEQWLSASDCEFGYRWSVFKGRLKGRCLVERVVFRLRDTFVPKLEYKALAEALQANGVDRPTATQVCDAVRAVRASKLPDPKEIGSAGSFFKNPVVDASRCQGLKSQWPDLVAFPVEGGYKLSAGWLIEHAGWKGRDLGAAGVYERQALVLVNRGGCTGEDVIRLAQAVVADVERQFGVRLEPEAIIIDN